MKKYEYLDVDTQLKLKRELDKNPLLMGDLLKFIGDYTTQYNEALQIRRNAEAKSAVYDLLMLYKIPPKGIPGGMLPCLIEPIRALYPKGYNHSHSIKSRIILDEFIKAAKKEGWKPTDTFIKDIRNFDEMLKMLYQQYENAGKIKV